MTTGDFLSGDFLTGDFVMSGSTASTATVTSAGIALGRRRIDLRKWYQLKDNVRVYTLKKKAQQLDENIETLPYLEPRRQRERDLYGASRDIASYRDEQKRVIDAISHLAKQTEEDPVVIGYRQMLRNGNLAKLAKTNPLAHQALEREYAAKVEQAVQLRAHQRQAEATQI